MSLIIYMLTALIVIDIVRNILIYASLDKLSLDTLKRMRYTKMSRERPIMVTLNSPYTL